MAMLRPTVDGGAQRKSQKCVLSLLSQLLRDYTDSRLAVTCLPLSRCSVMIPEAAIAALQCSPLAASALRVSAFDSYALLTATVQGTERTSTKKS
jgi:hypothetical protein